ncbi:MAG: polyhydroxyalkanoic acid system family protein [Simplicispira sp.]|nr:polyhydroxyalkanoic acid system family protein [Simplicispira sp.]
MPDIHIHRPHHLGLPAARKIALTWAEKVEEKFDMECTYEEGEVQDTLRFNRPGVKGTLQVQADQFELAAELGFLFSAFKGRIEAELSEQFDTLLGKKKPAAKKKPAKHKT